MEGTKLKDCPCCKSERVVRCHIMTANRNRVYCMDCGLRTPDFLDVKDAEKVWNRRAKDGKVDI